MTPICRRFGIGWLPVIDLAIRTSSPVSDLGLVDFVALVIGCGEAGRRADRAVDVNHTPADSTDQMMVVVADPVFEPGRRPGRLNPPDEVFGDQDAQRVVDRLKRDRADLSPDDLGYMVRSAVWLSCNRAKHREPLSRNLKTTLTKELSGIRGHLGSVDQVFESLKDRTCLENLCHL